MDISWRHRMVGGAYVEGDFESIVDGESARHGPWDDLVLMRQPRQISKEEAEKAAGGTPIESTLYILSQRNQFNLKVVPSYACWLVTTSINGIVFLIVVDGISGRRLGGSPPFPSSYYGFSGPIFECPPKNHGWDAFVNTTAEHWDRMGMPGERDWVPSKSEIERQLRDPQTAFVHWMAHGNYSYFWASCDNGSGNITGGTIDYWLRYQPKMCFGFIGSCGGMDKSGTFTISHALRKGCEKHTAVAGLKNIGQPGSQAGMVYGKYFNDVFFGSISMGCKMGDSFDFAMSEYPMCSVVRGFEGDRDYGPPYKRSHIALRTNKEWYFTSDRLTVYADADPMDVEFYPYVRLSGNGYSRYIVQGGDMTDHPTPYLENGPFMLDRQLLNYRVCDFSFHGIPKGKYIIEAAYCFGGGIPMEPVTKKEIVVR